MTTQQHTSPLPGPWSWDSDARHVIRDCSVDGWYIAVSFDTHAPWDGPTKLQVLADMRPDTVQYVADTSGLTTSVLRGIPLGEIRREYKEVLREINRASGQPQQPERIETDRDLALIAAHYAELVAAGHRSPIAEMAEVWAVGRKTMSARIQRARMRGLLEGERYKPATGLTEKARRLIAEAQIYEGE